MSLAAFFLPSPPLLTLTLTLIRDAANVIHVELLLAVVPSVLDLDDLGAKDLQEKSGNVRDKSKRNPHLAWP